jgi:hypothetical protein
MFLVNTKRQKQNMCVYGTGHRWDGVLISTRTTFRQLDFNQPLIPRKPEHRKLRLLISDDKSTSWYCAYCMSTPSETCRFSTEVRPFMHRTVCLGAFLRECASFDSVSHERSATSLSTSFSCDYVQTRELWSPQEESQVCPGHFWLLKFVVDV